MLFRSVNLARNVIKDEQPVLDDVKELLPDTTVEQNVETGNLEVALGGSEGDEFIYEVSPVEVTQVDESEGVTLEADSSVKIVTKHGQCIKGNAVPQDLPGLISELTSAFSLNTSLNVDIQSTLTQTSGLYPEYSHRGRADIVSTVVADDNISLGGYRIDSPYFAPGNNMIYTHVFQKCKKGKKGEKCKKGKKRRQKIHPCPVYPKLLKTGLGFKNSNVRRVAVELEGKVSFEFKGKFRQGILGYKARRGKNIPACGCIEFTPKPDTNDFEITYPDGKVQDLVIIPGTDG